MVAGTDDVKNLLITKKKREDYEQHLKKLERERLAFAALVAREEEKRREKFQREIENRKEKRRARNAAKLQASVEAKALKAEEGRRALERERMIQQSLVAAPTASNGLWVKHGPSKWAYREATRDEMKQVSTFDEAKALFEDTRGVEARTMLQRRWRATTGLELTKDHPVMGGMDAKVRL